MMDDLVDRDRCVGRGHGSLAFVFPGSGRRGLSREVLMKAEQFRFLLMGWEPEDLLAKRNISYMAEMDVR